MFLILTTQHNAAITVVVAFLVATLKVNYKL
jgi:hypothetical protein